MSYQRGIAAIRLQMPDEIPHTQYITNPDWLAYRARQAGQARRRSWTICSISTFPGPPTAPIPPGAGRRWGASSGRRTDQEYIPAEASPFTDVEEIYNLDPFAEYGRVDHKAKVAQVSGVV